MANESTVSGGIEFGGDASLGGDAVGRDKIVQNITQQTTPAEPIHNSLPSLPYFFGRAAELARIADALDPDAAGWGVLISGPGGIGKTALSIRAAHLAPEKVFPTKIFLSAKVRELTPQGVTDLQDFMLPNYIALLTELARELGEDDIAKGDPNQRANEVRRLLAERHALIVIDNLETFEEDERNRAFQFLGRLPHTCKALVTSRRWKDVRAESIRLDKLERSDALQLISKLAQSNKYLAKATEAERIELYETTRGNPLLIEWLAGQLGRQGSQCHTIADACKLLENVPEDDNKPLEFVFGDLLDTFTEHETAVLAALTYFTQPAQVKWIAEIAQITPTQAETALEDLADRSILVVGEVTDTSTKDPRTLPGYLLPPLTATFLRHARPEVIATAGNSLSNRAYALAQENGYEEHDRFPTLDAEWPTVAAAIPLLLQGNNDRLQGLCASLNTFFEFTGRWDDWLSLSLQAEDKALAAKDAHNADKAGWRAYQAGWVYRLRGQSAEVLACAERAERHWAKAGARERAAAIHLRGLGHRLAKDYPAAIVAYQEAVNLWRTLSPESEDVAIGLNDLAGAERMSGDYAAAERDYREALRIAKKVNYREGVATYTGNLANLALDREEWAEAERWAREALPLSEGVGRLELIASNYGRIAKACARQGRQAEGLPYAQRAVAIYTRLRSPNLAWAQATLKECEGA